MGILNNKVAVITGGTRGLGLAIAHAYAREGAAVVLASRSEESVTRSVQSLQESGARVAGLPCDVGDQAQVEALADYSITTFGHFDIWVNNAAISGPYGPTVQIALETFERVLRTNVFGVYYGTWAAMRHFIPRGEGKLINILGRGDRNPVPMQNAYASSKAWLRNFTLALAKETEGSGVGVYAFNPGMMTTDLLTQVEVVEGHEARLKPFRTITRMWANPPEVPAEKALWLASAATDARTGLLVRQTGIFFMLKGALRELFRRLLGRPEPPMGLDIRSIPPASQDYG